MGIGALGPLMAAALFLGVGLVVAAIGVFVGLRNSARSNGSKRLKWFAVVLLSGVAPVVSCGVVPNLLFHLRYGRFPASYEQERLVRKGMTTGEVNKLLGEAHYTYERHPVRWVYWTDSLATCYFWVEFGPDDRVVATGGD